MQATLHHHPHEEETEQPVLGTLDQLEADKLWCLIIRAFVFILVATFLALTVAVFLKVQSDMLLTVFTSAMTFLAGLVTPSPRTKGK